MSGFSPDWLALREPADRRARDAGLAVEAARLASSSGTARLVDLGCGTGSNLRALAPLLPDRQSWRLVDHDPALLEAAADALRGWSDRSERVAGGLVLHSGGREIRVTFTEADLSGDPGTIFAELPTLVTAAALFDLVSAAWIEHFAQTLAAARLPLYTVLTYDGKDEFAPAHPLDGTVLDAFHRHQAIDKGFGPAAGRNAPAALDASFAACGYTVRTAPSPWLLDAPRDTALITELTSGIASAAAEAGVPEQDARRWAGERRDATSARIGHVDLLAMPT
jgi:hypothetical protein